MTTPLTKVPDSYVIMESNVTSYPSIRTPSIPKDFHIVAFSLLMITIVTGNALTLVAIAGFSFLQQKRYILVGSLAVADILCGLSSSVVIIGITSSPEVEHIDDGNCPGHDFSTFSVMIVDFPVYVSHVHILLMAVDRFIAVTFPLHYVTLMSWRRTWIAVASAWVFSVFYVLTYLLWPSDSTHGCGADAIPYAYVIMAQFVFYVIVVITLIVIYIQILVITQRHQVRRMEVINFSGRNNNTIGDEKKKSQFRNIKASRYAAAVIGAYVITWLPFFLDTIPPIFLDHLYQSDVWKQSVIVTMQVSYLNCGINVFIYAGFLSDFRKAYKTLLHCSDSGRVSSNLNVAH